MRYIKCKDCLANYPDRQDYKHECFGLMKMLVQFNKKRNENIKTSKKTRKN